MANVGAIAGSSVAARAQPIATRKLSATPRTTAKKNTGVWLKRGTRRRRNQRTALSNIANVARKLTAEFDASRRRKFRAAVFFSRNGERDRAGWAPHEAKAQVDETRTQSTRTGTSPSGRRRACAYPLHRVRTPPRRRRFRSPCDRDHHHVRSRLDVPDVREVHAAIEGSRCRARPHWSGRAQRERLALIPARPPTFAPRVGFTCTSAPNVRCGPEHAPRCLRSMIGNSTGREKYGSRWVVPFGSAEFTHRIASACALLIRRA